LNFNSIDFVVFFVIVLFLYHRMRLRGQNRVLLAASYLFYGWWNYRFLALILISTLVDYVAGQKIHSAANEKIRRRWLILSIVINLGILFLFKYFNFFMESLVSALRTLGVEASPESFTFRITLPVGISFYTFQTMSYTIDIFRRKLTPTRSLTNFAVFVAFFPQLVAGPIERATRLLPQIEKKRTLTAKTITSGVWLILLGYFKKVAIADNLGRIATVVFDYPGTVNGWDIPIGVLAFAGQIYGDFSGYSDIARGTSRLLGLDLMKNFRMPYLAANPQEFWSRWHISLSTWLRDYLYISLGGNRKSRAKTYRNLSLTMLLGGIWHGAAWHFAAWGVFHGLLLVFHRAVSGRLSVEEREKRRSWTLSRWLKVVFFFQVICLGWVLFRVNHLTDLAHLWDRMMCGGCTLLIPALSAFALTVPLVILDFLEEKSGNEMVIHDQAFVWRVLSYIVLCGIILVFGVRDGIEFIYFQF